MFDRPVIIRKRKPRIKMRHGGSWKVAYADFVTAMMAFFMVMWILGMSEKDRSIIAAYFNDPIGFSKSEQRASVNLVKDPSSPIAFQQGQTQTSGSDPREDDEKKMRGISKQVTAALKTDKDLSKLVDQVQATITSEGLRIELVEKKHSAFFDSGKATLKPRAAKLIARIAPIIGKAGRHLTIEGHTDARTYSGTGYTNWELSQDRAASVRRALCESGVADGQLRGVLGYAATRLKDPRHPFAEANRRVSILLPYSEEAKGRANLPGDQLKRETKRRMGVPDFKF